MGEFGVLCEFVDDGFLDWCHAIGCFVILNRWCVPDGSLCCSPACSLYVFVSVMSVWFVSFMSIGVVSGWSMFSSHSRIS